MTFPTEIVRAEPDITLKELAGALEATHGVSVQLSSIHRALIRAGFSYEKGLVAQERDRADIRLARHDRIVRRQPFSRIGARTCDTLVRALCDICGLFDPKECWTFFKAARYASCETQTALILWDIVAKAISASPGGAVRIADPEASLRGIRSDFAIERHPDKCWQAYFPKRSDLFVYEPTGPEVGVRLTRPTEKGGQEGRPVVNAVA